MIRSKMKNCNDINREAAKMLALSSGKIVKQEYFTDKEIFPSNQRQILEQAEFAYFPLEKAFEKQTKTSKDQEDKNKIDKTKIQKSKKSILLKSR